MIAVGTCRTRCEHPQGEPAERRARRPGCRRWQEECRRDRAYREAVRGDGANREPVDQQRAGVVEQALTFENGQQAMRRPELDAAPRSRRPRRAARRWRRARWPAPTAFPAQRASDDGNSDGGQSDRDDHQARDRRPVVLEVAQRCVVGGVEQHRRDEQRQRQLRRQRQLGRARQKREQSRRRARGTPDRARRCAAPPPPGSTAAAKSASSSSNTCIEPYC